MCNFVPLSLSKPMENKTQELATVEQAVELGLLPEEFEKIKEILGRTPNFTETSIYSVMWSEHCSYKNSIRWLKTLPKEGPQMLVKAGEENAGLVDIGDGVACVFKIESHNHPSAIEPYQGAATGVGGINRDIFTMGARPIAQLNSLRFGEIDKEKTKWLVKGVVKGIGDYGNSFGVPIVGGEVFFDKSYNTNPLVNAFSAGILEGDMISATSSGVGNPVYIVGSSTGKDGIAGAAFASKDITEESADDLPSVQVGDPFQEKLLLEATLELAKTDAVFGMQDMGAAGITCSSCEMSAAGDNVGMDIDLSKVPTRQENMKDWEILLSESQERMLVVIKKGKEKIVEDIFEKWDLHAVQIGVVTEGGTINYSMNGEVVASVPAESLVLGGGGEAELDAAARVAQSLGAVAHKTVHVDLRSIGGSALTDDIDVPEAGGPGIPVTYVPARNTIMLSVALGWAEVLGASDIFCGVNAVDYSGYPDCRPEFIEAFEKLANLATKAGVEGAGLRIHAPLLRLSKADIVREGMRLGVDFSQTVSCYQADDQGRACRHCDACRLRAAGFADAGVPDPTHYA